MLKLTVYLRDPCDLGKLKINCQDLWSKIVQQCFKKLHLETANNNNKALKQSTKKQRLFLLTKTYLFCSSTKLKDIVSFVRFPSYYFRSLYKWKKVASVYLTGDLLEWVMSWTEFFRKIIKPGRLLCLKCSTLTHLSVFFFRAGTISVSTSTFRSNLSVKHSLVGSCRGRHSQDNGSIIPGLARYINKLQNCHDHSQNEFLSLIKCYMLSWSWLRDICLFLSTKLSSHWW